MRFWKALERMWLLPLAAGLMISCGSSGGDGGEAPVAPPAAPAGLTASAGDARATLNWTATAGATGYRVKRAITGGTFAVVGSPTGATYVSTGLTNGTLYRFVVSAINAGGEGPNSAEVTCQPVAPQVPPVVPTGLAAIPLDQGAILNWNASPEATGYKVYRAEGAGALALIASPTSNTHSDAGLTNGTTYRYAVSAINGNGESAQSAGVNCTPAAGGIYDPLDSFNDTLFQKANWANGSMFYCGWLPDHVTFADGVMTLTLDDIDSHTKPYSSGEYRTDATLGYGTFETRMKAAKASGTTSTFFTYTASPWDEIDVEILGKDTTKVQFNYFVNGVGGHERVVDLGFDASAAFHTYTIQWASGSIQWYVDGVLKHSVTGGTLPTHPMQMMVNLWPGTGVDEWLGAFTYTSPLHASYDYLRYTPAAE